MSKAITGFVRLLNTCLATLWRALPRSVNSKVGEINTAVYLQGGFELTSTRTDAKSEREEGSKH